MKVTTMLGGAVIAAAAAGFAVSLPEIQRYLKVRKM